MEDFNKKYKKGSKGYVIGCEYHYNEQYHNPIPCGGIALHQLGELLFYPGAEIGRHENTYLEFTFVLDGKGTVVAGEEIYDVRANDCVLSVPGEAHYIKSSADAPMRYAFTAFAREDEGGIYEPLFKSLEELRAKPRLCSMPDGRETFFDLCAEMQSSLPFKFVRIGGLLSSLIIKYLRAMQNLPTHELPPPNNRKMLAFRIRDYIDTYYLDLASVGGLGAVFHYNQNSLETVFLEAFGESISGYLRRLKMEKALGLLTEGRSVTETGEILKYGSIHSFSKSFKAYFGVPPTKHFEIKTTDFK
ncbi:MAG: AraC family transcriptional regulator [Clostridiales bacterium]|nr:AraC family transcriptional regulator [Clostridiales bacterium]